MINPSKIPFRCILIVNPGRVRESLQAILKANDLIDIVGIAGGGLSASKQIISSNPEIVVLDGNLAEDEALEIILWLQSNYPNVKTLILVENNLQRNILLAGGADFVISKGFLSEQLADTIDCLQMDRSEGFQSPSMDEFLYEDKK